MRPRFRWQLRSSVVELGAKTLLMGVLNVTPDSFSDGGRFLAPEHAIAHGLKMLDEGAQIIDIGGESTRPGAQVAGQPAALPAGEELLRVMPVIQGILRARPEAMLSIDTYKAEVARAAVSAGAEIVNDVSAFQWDSQMASTCAELKCGMVMMHTRGKPQEWRSLSREPNIVERVEHDLANRIQVAFERGIERSRIVLDPGFGFGKNFEENYTLLGSFGQLQRLGFPLLAGTSQKSFIGRTLGKRMGADVPAAGRLHGSIAAMVISILQGAHVVRVHDVKPAVESAAIADDVLAAIPEPG